MLICTPSIKCHQVRGTRYIKYGSTKRVPIFFSLVLTGETMLTSPYPSNQACCSSVKMRVVPDPRGLVIATTPAAPKLSCPKSDSRERTASSSSVTTRTTIPCGTSVAHHGVGQTNYCYEELKHLMMFALASYRILCTSKPFGPPSHRAKHYKVRSCQPSRKGTQQYEYQHAVRVL